LPAADFQGLSRQVHAWPVSRIDTLGVRTGGRFVVRRLIAGAMRLFGHVWQIFATSHAQSLPENDA
jgi:hypothetical protein